MKTKYKTLEFVGQDNRYSMKCLLTGECHGKVDVIKHRAYMGRPAKIVPRVQINMPKSWLTGQDLRDIADFLDQLNRGDDD